MPVELPIHPSTLTKAVVREYICRFIAPGDDAPSFGDDAEFPTYYDEEMLEMNPLGPDVSVFEDSPATELYEGIDVWTVSVNVAITMPGDCITAFAVKSEKMWQMLSGIYDSAVESPGGDASHPLAGRLTAMSKFLTDQCPGSYPRIICFSDVTELKKEPPLSDAAPALVAIFSFKILAEVMPPAFQG